MRKKLWLPPTRAPTGIKPLAWVCSLTRTRTRHLLVRGTTEPTGQDSPFPFFTRPQAPAHLGTACLFSLQVFLGRNTHTGSCWPQTGWFLDYSPCSSVLSKFPRKCTDRDTTREDTVSCSHGGEGSMGASSHVWPVFVLSSHCNEHFLPGHCVPWESARPPPSAASPGTCRSAPAGVRRAGEPHRRARRWLLFILAK